MNIIGTSGNDTSGIAEALRGENEYGQRAELVSARSRETRNTVAARSNGSSDTVSISETAMLLASGLLTPGMFSDADDSSADQAVASLGAQANTLRNYTGYLPLGYVRTTAQRAKNAAAAASATLLAPQLPGEEQASEDIRAQHNGVPASGRNAVSDIARLQSRIRELQQELSSLENGDLPEQVKTAQAHSLNTHIHQAMQDINGLTRRARA